MMPARGRGVGLEEKKGPQQTKMVVCKTSVRGGEDGVIVESEAGRVKNSAGGGKRYSHMSVQRWIEGGGDGRELGQARRGGKKQEFYSRKGKRSAAPKGGFEYVKKKTTEKGQETEWA